MFKLKRLIIALAVLVSSFIAHAETHTTTDYSQFIAEQKAKEQSVIAPYKNEVSRLAIQAEKNAQAPDIQAYIQQLKNHSVNTDNASAGNRPDTSGQILIFVSSSMPQTSLVQWMQQAQRIKAALIIRGFVNNSVPDTKNWVRQLMEQNNKKGGVQINPVAFERFAIQQVPAVVATTRTLQCPPGMSCMTPPFDVVYGNVSLTQALKILSEQGDSAKTIAKENLALIRDKA